MRIVLATVGTRGDVQPMLALAQALILRGHEAILACPDAFGSWIQGHGIEHRALGEDLQALMMEGGSTATSSIARMTSYFSEQMKLQAPRLLEITTGAQAIVGTAMAWTAPSVAEKLRIPALELLPSNCIRSRLHPPPLLPLQGMPHAINAFLWWLNDLGQNKLMGDPLNAARTRIGLAPVASFTNHLFVDTPCVLAVEEALLPPDPAWQERYPYAGFLFLDDNAALDPALDAWLSSGDPPICVGFGSMAGGEPERVATLLHDAIRTTGRRCVVLGGKAALFENDALPGGFFCAREAPHASLFPRVAVVVHHGGSGTTGAASRAGVPQVVLPMMLDQFHHAHHLVRAGLAPRAPSMAKTTAKKLALAIDRALALPVDSLRAMARRIATRDAGNFIVDRLEQMVR